MRVKLWLVLILPALASSMACGVTNRMMMEDFNSVSAIERAYREGDYRTSKRLSEEYLAGSGRESISKVREIRSQSTKAVEYLDAGPAPKGEPVLDRISVRTDEVDRIQWFSHVLDGVGGSVSDSRLPEVRLKLYFGSRAERLQPWLCLRVEYRGGAWLFAESLTVATGGERYQLDALDFSRIVAARGVLESAQLVLDPEGEQAVRAIADSEECTIRLRGRGEQLDYKVTDLDRLRFRDVLTAFELGLESKSILSGVDG